MAEVVLGPALGLQALLNVNHRRLDVLVAQHSLDFRDGRSGSGVKGGKGGSEPMLGQVSESELHANPLECLPAELGPVRFAIFGREHPWTGHLRH